MFDTIRHFFGEDEKSKRDLELPRHLDISYITPKLMAAGLLWKQRTERRSHRNNIHEVATYLNKRYPKRYLLFNLSDTTYDTSSFHHQTILIPMAKQGPPPPLKCLMDVCRAIDAWLKLDPTNVVFIHCHNGISKTSLVMSAYLAYSGFVDSAMEAFDFFVERRCPDDHSWISSWHRRYIRYFQDVLQMAGKVPNPVPLRLHSIIMNSIPDMDGKGSCCPALEIYQDSKLVYSTPLIRTADKDVLKDDYNIIFRIFVNDAPIILEKDVYIRVLHRTTNAPVTIFTLSFHTGFMGHGLVRIQRSDLDLPDSKHKNLSIDLITSPAPSSSSSLISYASILTRSVTSSFAKLVQFHAIRPDDDLVKTLEAQGYLKMTAKFALQRTLNDVHEAHAYLRSQFSKEIMDLLSKEMVEMGRVKYKRFKNERKLQGLKKEASQISQVTNESMADYYDQVLESTRSSLAELHVDEKEEESSPQILEKEQVLDKLLQETSTSTKERKSELLDSTLLSQSLSPDPVLSQPFSSASTAALDPTPVSPVPPPSENVPTEPQLPPTSLPGIPPPPPPPPPVSSSTGIPLPPPPPSPGFGHPQQIVPKKRVKNRLHWSEIRVSDVNLENTIWSGSVQMTAVPLDIKKFEELFCIEPGEASKKQVTKKEVKEISVLDSNRARMVSIVLARWQKRYTFSELREAVCRNDQDLTLDDLLALKSILPTEQERAQFNLLSTSQTNLTLPCDLFMFEMMKEPNLEFIVSCYIFKYHIHQDTPTLLSKFETIESVCKQLRDDALLKQLLQHVFHVGKLVNYKYTSSHHTSSQTVGFKIDTLLKLNDVKGVDGSTTLMTYLVQSIFETPAVKCSQAYGVLKTVRHLKTGDLDVNVNEIVRETEKMTMYKWQRGGLVEWETFKAGFLDTFLEECQGKVKALENASTKMKQSWIETALYFGEEISVDEGSGKKEASKKPEDFFMILDQFFQCFDEAVRGEERKRENAKRAASAPKKEVNRNTSIKEPVSVLSLRDQMLSEIRDKVPTTPSVSDLDVSLENDEFVNMECSECGLPMQHCDCTF